jgi:hypoxanthine phosphoribosyltransferase
MELKGCSCPNSGFCKTFNRNVDDGFLDWCQNVNIEVKESYYKLIEKTKNNKPTPKRVHNPNRFVTITDLQRATLKLMPLIEEFDGIVGVPRSGMIPASILSSLCNKPLFSITDNKLEMLKFMSNFGGSRMVNFKTNKSIKDMSLVFIDDTTHCGISSRRLKETFGKNISVMSVYSTDFGSQHIEGYSELLHTPHLLEWNFFNSTYADITMFDIDGVFCDNIPIDICEDEEKYTKYIEGIAPKFHRIPKLFKASKLVTGRLEKYRGTTENWLKRYGFNYDELVMFPTDREAERNANHFQVVGEYKAEVFNSDKQQYFVESELSEAKVIKSLTNKTVICPNEGIVL